MPGILTTPGVGRKVVTTAGTPVALVAASTPVFSVVIVAETDNTGAIVLGSSGVIAALATRQGAPLAAGDALTLTSSDRMPEAVLDLVDLYIDSTVSGDGVTFTYVK